MRAALASAGATFPAPAGVLLATRPPEIAAALARAARLRGATHVGVGVALSGGTAWGVLLAAERRAELEPFPREVSPGTRVQLRGRLVGLSRPRVYVASPAGWARELPVRESGGGFEAEVLLDQAGPWRLEVMGEGAGGPTVAALLDAVARAPGGTDAVPPPDAPPASAAGGGPAPPDAGEARVLAALEALRARQGLAPLQRDATLDAVARRHSQAMLAAGTVAHVLRGGPDVVGRLRDAGVEFRVASENVARGEDALDAQRAVEESPAHLANLLSPLVRNVGVGVARGAMPGGQPVVYLTQVLVQPADEEAWTSLTPEGRAKEAIAAERARAGRPPLAFEAALDVLARDAAREMLRRGDPDPGELAGRALALRPAARGRGGTDLAAADAFVAVAPADAARGPNAADPRWRRAGVGVARGDSPRFGAGLYWIAVVYTD
jgi:uncharacterized protein YkwD